MAIGVGMRVRAGLTGIAKEVEITTEVNLPLALGGMRQYRRTKRLGPGQHLFGTVKVLYETQHEVVVQIPREDGAIVLDEPEEPMTKILQCQRGTALIRWDGKRERTSVLSLNDLSPQRR